MALLAGRPAYSKSRTVPTLTERTLPVEVAIGFPPSRCVHLVSNAIEPPMSGWVSARVGRKHFYVLFASWFCSEHLAVVIDLGSHARLARRPPWKPSAKF